MVLGLALKRDPAWTDTLVELTGHFDDPAAPTCHVELTASAVSHWTGPQTIINQCRQTFVVTNVTVLPGP